MSYRYIFSQMFDVRPRSSSGELDLEKIKKIKTILNLRLSELAPSERIINLKPKRPERKIVIPERSVPVLKEADSSVIPPRSEKAGMNFWPEYSDVCSLSRSSILSILEIIEATEQILKEKGGRSVPDILANAAKPPVSVIAEAGAGMTREALADASGLPVEEIFIPAVPAEWKAAAEEILAPESDNNPVFRLEQESRKTEMDKIMSREAAIEPFWLRGRLSEKEKIASNYVLTPPEFSLGTLSARSAGSVRFWGKPIKFFFVTAVVVFALIPLAGWLNRAVSLRSDILNSGMTAYQSLLKAKDSLTQADFIQAENDFTRAHDYFASADSKINVIGEWLTPVLEKIPGFSGLTSRIRLVAVGKKMSAAGANFTQIINLFDGEQIRLSGGDDAPALTVLIKQARQFLAAGASSLLSAQSDLSAINVSSLPLEVRSQAVLLTDQLPRIAASSAAALDWTDKFLSILGEKKIKKYLLIFQNNSEIRATGGFIGTYGLLDLDEGRVKKLFIDGIFNPDGQLTAKIVPPQPIQKISTAWSMHDSNWFADFPTSARKTSWFYEKTGGETTDGVISLTPVVVERLLRLTGPIDMPEYGVTLSAENFVESTQFEVEVDYDKAQNQPKKILADFAPKFLEKLSQEIEHNGFDVLKIINDCLKEKHILFYFSDPELENFVVDQGWGGELKRAAQDYFSVVDSNIDGRKTDRVIDEKIKLASRIEEDGSVIDTLTITRHHHGGASEYAWFNHVNPDYLRVYLPKGTELIYASGQTKEAISPPIDYAAAGFKTDNDVSVMEQSLKIDGASGTQIFEETGKTVFGNWVYVSAGETVTLIYQYRLPMKLDVSKPNMDFSILAQKQSGSVGRQVEYEFTWPESWRLSAVPESGRQSDNHLYLKTDLEIDRLLNLNFINGQ